MDRTTLAHQKQYITEFHIRDTLRKWRESGLSQAEFCRREGMQEWQLSNWKRREEKLVGGQKAAPRQERKKTKPAPRGIEFAAVENKPAVPIFLPVDTAARRSPPRHKLDHPVAEIGIGELTIRIWPGADRETLASLLQALKEYALC